MLREVPGLEECVCAGSGGSMSKGLEVRRGSVLFKGKNQSGQQRLVQEITGDPRMYNTKGGHDVVSRHFPKPVL